MSLYRKGISQHGNSTDRPPGSRSPSPGPLPVRRESKKEKTPAKKQRPSTSSVSSLASLKLTGAGDGLSRADSGRKVRTVDRKPKMDVARATGIMGFSSSRWLDKSQTGADPKKELDKALFTQMQELLKKKRDYQKEKEKMNVITC